MKFLVDAQLPRRLAVSITAAEHDAIHTLDLPDGNTTTDAQINDISEKEQRIVISKDADFVNTFLLEKKPYKLLLVYLTLKHTLNESRNPTNRPLLCGLEAESS